MKTVFLAFSLSVLSFNSFGSECLEDLDQFQTIYKQRLYRFDFDFEQLDKAREGLAKESQHFSEEGKRTINLFNFFLRLSDRKKIRELGENAKAFLEQYSMFCKDSDYQTFLDSGNEIVVFPKKTIYQKVISDWADYRNQFDDVQKNALYLGRWYTPPMVAFINFLCDLGLVYRQDQKHVLKPRHQEKELILKVLGCTGFLKTPLRDLPRKGNYNLEDEVRFVFQKNPKTNVLVIGGERIGHDVGGVDDFPQALIVNPDPLSASDIVATIGEVLPFLEKFKFQTIIEDSNIPEIYTSKVIKRLYQQLKPKGLFVNRVFSPIKKSLFELFDGFVFNGFSPIYKRKSFQEMDKYDLFTLRSFFLKKEKNRLLRSSDFFISKTLQNFEDLSLIMMCACIDEDVQKEKILLDNFFQKQSEREFSIPDTLFQRMYVPMSVMLEHDFIDSKNEKAHCEKAVDHFFLQYPLLSDERKLEVLRPYVRIKFWSEQIEAKESLIFKEVFELEKAKPEAYFKRLKSYFERHTSFFKTSTEHDDLCFLYGFQKPEVL